MALRCWSGFAVGWISHWAAVQCSQGVEPGLGWPLTFKRAFWWLAAVIHPTSTLQTGLKRDIIWSLLELIPNHQQKHFKEWSSVNCLKTSWRCIFLWRRKLSQSGQLTWQPCWCLRSGVFERSCDTVMVTCGSSFRHYSPKEASHLPVGSPTKTCSDFPPSLPQCLCLWPCDQAESFPGSLGLSSWAGIRSFKRRGKEGACRELICHFLALLSPLIPSGLAKSHITCFHFPSRQLWWLHKFSCFFFNFTQCLTLNSVISSSSPCILQERKDKCLPSSSLCL